MKKHPPSHHPLLQHHAVPAVIIQELLEGSASCLWGPTLSPSRHSSSCGTTAVYSLYVTKHVRSLQAAKEEIYSGLQCSFVSRSSKYIYAREVRMMNMPLSYHIQMCASSCRMCNNALF